MAKTCKTFGVGKVAWVFLFFCAVAEAALCQASPPAPVLANVYPDRVAQGDLITLTGSHLVPDGSSPSVYVTFNPSL